MESLEKKFSVLLLAGFSVIAIGYNLNVRGLLYTGLIILGIAVTGRGIARFFIVKENNLPRKKLAVLSNYYIAGFQFIFGLAIIAATITEMFSGCISSGRFWQQVTATVSPLLIIFLIGLFFAVSGVSLMGSVEKSNYKSLKNSLQNFSEILQGIIPFVFGLILIAIVILLVIFR